MVLPPPFERADRGLVPQIYGEPVRATRFAELSGAFELREASEIRTRPHPRKIPYVVYPNFRLANGLLSM